MSWYRSAVWSDSAFILGSVIGKAATHNLAHCTGRTFVHYWKQPLLAFLAPPSCQQDSEFIYGHFHFRFKDQLWPFLLAQCFRNPLQGRVCSVQSWWESLVDKNNHKQSGRLQTLASMSFSNDRQVKGWMFCICIPGCCVVVCAKSHQAMNRPPLWL